MFIFIILLLTSAEAFCFGRLSHPKEEGTAAEAVPEEMKDVGILENMGGKISLDLPFIDHKGQSVQLGDYFDGKTPVMLALVYYTCPNLCNLHLNGVVNTLKDLNWQMGKEYRFVVISIDPKDTPETALAKRDNYLKLMGRSDPGDKAWPFLMGTQNSIDQIAREVGFRYKWDEKSEQWVHTAAAYVVTPEGKISFYHYGVAPQLNTIRLSLVDASAKRIGTIVDRIALFCLRYDPNQKNYSFYVMNIVRAISAFFALALAFYLFWFWRRQRLVG